MERRSSEDFRTVVLRLRRTLLAEWGPKAEFADFLFCVVENVLERHFLCITLHSTSAEDCARAFS